MTARQSPKTLPRVVWDDEWEAPPEPTNSRISVVGVFVAAGLLAGGVALVTSLVWDPDGKMAWVPPATQGYALSHDSRPGTVVVPRPMMSRDDVWGPNEMEPTESSRLPRPQSAPPVIKRPTTGSPAPQRAAPVPEVDRSAGYLFINSTPWAELSVDGRTVGNTPQVKIRVRPGQHHLLLVRDGYQPHSAWVDVAAGATVRITDIALKEIGP